MHTRPLVLVAIDHRTDAAGTIDVALGVARSRGADVHVIRVAPPVPLEPHADPGLPVGALPASTPRAADDDGVRVRHVTLRGRPEQVIPAYAQLHGAAMLVVARSYGRSRLWPGAGVVDAVARRSPMPLLVVPERHSRERSTLELRRIVTPVDFSVGSAVALKTAVELSRRHRARLTLVHAMTDLSQHMVFSGSEAWRVVQRLPARVDAVARHLQRAAALFGGHDVDTAVTTGVAAGAILDSAARTGADLVVMGIAHRSWLDRLLFGSTLRRVLRRATVPVFVVPVVGGAERWPDSAAGGPIWRQARTASAVAPVAA